LFAHRPHQWPIENRVRIGNHLHAPSRTNHHRTRLTFDALAAGKPGAPPELTAGAIAAFTSLADWGGGIGWAPAMPSPLHGQLTNFLILFHYCDG
jgi:hypothetical protein